MPIVDELKINGQTASGLTPVIVSGLNPVFRWEYIQDAVSTSQSGFDVRISSSSSGVGTDLFYGDVYPNSWTIPSQYAQSSTNVFEFESRDLTASLVKTNLSRGVIYYGQIRAFDPSGYPTPWVVFSFQPNNIPFITNCYLYPLSPTSDDSLEIVYTYNDLDGHADCGSKIKWYKNGLPQTQYDNMCILPSNSTTAGEYWAAKVIPFDGLEYGVPVETDAVIVGNALSAFSSIRILPQDANVDDILKAEYSLDEYTDSNNAVELEWYKNNIAVPDSNQTHIRLDTSPGDTVYVIAKITDGVSVVSQQSSSEITISDTLWHVSDFNVNGLTESGSLSDLTPVLSWEVFKSKSEINQKPLYYNVKVGSTPSLNGCSFDSGVLEYTKNSYIIPSGILSRGRRYFIHLAVSDSIEIDASSYSSKEVQTTGSSWASDVDNSTGWTIEYKVSLDSTSDNSNPNLGIYIHDGTYFCCVTMGLRYITLLSESSVTYNYTNQSSLSSQKTFRISAKNQDIKIFLDNQLVINAADFLTSTSNLKRIEYGDIDTQKTNSGTFRFLRYSTIGPYGFGLNLPYENYFCFSNVGTLAGGSIDAAFENYLSWCPDDEAESSKLITFNPNSVSARLFTATKNYSPITKIHIDSQRNKYIGTANGVTAIYGEKHSPDYSLSKNITPTIKPQDFDRISSVPQEYWSLVESDTSSNWFTIDTTYRALPNIVENIGDEYDPYLVTQSHAIHYFSQRVHGHAWFDNVDNAKGWSAGFSFNLEKLEADDFYEFDLDKHGFGVYLNDGSFQEILYFYEDRIRLFYANVFVSIDTTVPREYVITGKNSNINIYQRRKETTSQFSLLLDGAGLFTTPASHTGNSSNPKIAIDHEGTHHAVWHDDGNHRSRIFYSSFDGASWSNPEIISQSVQFSFGNPDISIDSNNKVWVAYEDTSWGPTEISVSVKDSIGWNTKTRITNNPSKKSRPSIQVDHDDNVHVVWEDNRNGRWEIFWAKWSNSTKSWTSSAQFGEDTAVSQYDAGDPYQAGRDIDFKNADLCVFGDYLWLVCEGKFNDSGQSSIFGSFLDLTDNMWNSSGFPIVDENGDLEATGMSLLSSPQDRDCINPSICSNELLPYIVICYEDITEPVSQIWATTVNQSGLLGDPIQVSSRTSNCSNPVCGWAGDCCLILFESENTIYSCSYNGNTETFYGANLGNNDIVVETYNNVPASHPSIPEFSPSTDVKIVYDFFRNQDPYLDPYLVSTAEVFEFKAIGDSSVLCYGDNEPSIITSSSSSVSSEDLKEFAFGDFSDNVGIKAYWGDFSMYFGYDAKPYSIISYNSDTIAKWPNDKINDLFVDYYGNIIAATGSGLAYLNLSTGEVVNIQGYTTAYSDTAGCTDETCLLYGKTITAVAWGKNGIWYVGTPSGMFYSQSAGRYWEKLLDTDLGTKTIYSIDIDSQGRAVVGANDAVYVVHPSMSSPIVITLPYSPVKVVKVDESNIIWAGGDNGVYRIENFSTSNILHFARNEGMRSSHVNDIAIVSKHLRYIATAAGIERMHGTRFTNFNAKTHEILNNNISSLCWDNNTSSLWVGCLYRLHEIVFRDPYHDIISNETTYYDSSEISTDNDYDRSTYMVLDVSEIQNDQDNPLMITEESAIVYINKNKIDFGYTIGETGDKINFLCDLLVGDQVEVDISNKFVNTYDFNQSDIEKSVKGDIRTKITKLERTRRDQLLLLSDSDKHAILMYGGEVVLPFTTILLDRDSPIGCLEQVSTISQNILRFKVTAYDSMSGIDGMILSNYENFTSDGTTPLDYQTYQSVVDHNIGSGLTNIFDSLVLPETTAIESIDYSVGNGSSLGTWFDGDSNTTFLYAGISNPSIMFKYNPNTDAWVSLQCLDAIDSNRQINEIKTIQNVVWVATGTSTVGGNGTLYKSTDGVSFVSVCSVTGQHVRGITDTSDGTIYFGSSDGKIYAYKDSLVSVKYTDIGESIYSLTCYNNTLLAATGNSGRIYSIDTLTGSNLIIFDGGESYLSNVIVQDVAVGSSTETTIFAASGDYTTIYRASTADLSFVKSFSSFGTSVNRLWYADCSTLVESEDTSASGYCVLAAIGNNLYKYSYPSWEFVYAHDEEIKDFVQFSSNGVTGIWVISDSKITKWTNVVSSKTVYLRLKDKAGNVSSQPVAGDCPNDNSSVCCRFAYSVNIQDLQNFVNESRLVEVNEYGTVEFSYNSPNNKLIYSGDKVNEEIGVYESDVFNGSNNLVAWKSITWESNEPTGTEVVVQIRSSSSQGSISESEWSDDLVKNSRGFVPIEYISDQFIQFRVILTSSIRDISPSLTSVTIRNITSQASHFFTTNFILPARPIKGLLTANTFMPVSADIVFGICTKDSADFGDYQLIEPNRLFSLDSSQTGANLRIGAKLLSPNILNITPTNDPGDPYDAQSEICYIPIDFTNSSGSAAYYHFRARFYNDRYRTQLIYTFFTGNDQTGWDYGLGSGVFPTEGLLINDGESASITFTPGSQIENDQKWYISIDSYNGDSFESIIDNESFICSDYSLSYEAGLIAQYYKTGMYSLTEIPEFNNFNPDYILVENDINFPESTTDWLTSGGLELEEWISNWAARWRGNIQIPVSGNYKFTLTSSDGARLFIDMDEVINHDGLHSFTSEEATVYLLEGFHDIELQYFQGTGVQGVQLFWQPPDESDSVIIPSSSLFHVVTTEYAETSNIPKILNFAVVFEMEDGQTIKINLEQ